MPIPHHPQKEFQVYQRPTYEKQNLKYLEENTEFL